jgi:hypothetical protein
MHSTPLTKRGTKITNATMFTTNYDNALFVIVVVFVTIVMVRRRDRMLDRETR